MIPFSLSALRRLIILESKRAILSQLLRKKGLPVRIDDVSLSGNIIYFISN